MSIEELKEKVWRANLDLVEHNLVTLTWGNVSGRDRKKDWVVIKPSGLSYKELKPENMVVVDLKGNRLESGLKPSSDTATHLVLYKIFSDISGIAHTHSDYATIFAQASRPIPCLGTTHADHFHGEVPLTRMISEKEVEEDYEGNTGRVIVERFKNLDPIETPGVLVPGHGAFAWGKSPEEAVVNSLAIEKVAKMAWGTLLLAEKEPFFPEFLLEKHYLRKHGPKAYYGQTKDKIS
jgi:L-ribulose-5-phosphate 4-epimerase